MTERHPYTPSTGGLVKAIEQLKRSFPSEVTADTLRKLGIAPKNESYIINVLRFLGVVDEQGHETEAAARVFRQHDQEEFNEGFAGMVATAYSDLFELHGESAWQLESNKLISFFRQSDRTTDLVGRRQASTFQALATLVGKASAEAKQRASSARTGRATQASRDSRKPRKEATAVSAPATEGQRTSQAVSRQDKSVALTVRIEINLPADGDQATYDRIFKSLKANLVGD